MPSGAYPAGGARATMMGDEIVFTAGPMTAMQRREYAHYVLEVEQPSRRR
jgi:hypothetical protein